MIKFSPFSGAKNRFLRRHFPNKLQKHNNRLSLASKQNFAIRFEYPIGLQQTLSVLTTCISSVLKMCPSLGTMKFVKPQIVGKLSSMDYGPRFF